MVRSRRHSPWSILAVLCIAVLIVVIDNTIVNVALPTLSAKLNASDSGLQWIVDSYSLPFAGLLLAGGELSDRWGRRRVMQISLLFFAAFSLVAAESHSMTQLLIARALMGASAAFIFPATLSLVTTAFDDLANRAKAYGIWGATAGIAIAIGPIAGGYLIDHFWFGSVFIVNVPVACVTIALAAYLVPESRAPVLRRVDLGGLFLGSVAISTLVLGIIEGPSWGWLSAKVFSLFVIAVLSLLLFGIYERRLSDPMLDIKLFRRGAFSAAAAAIAASFFCLFGFVFLVTQYFQLVHGFSPLSAGVHTLPFAIVTMIATPLGAVVALRIGIRWVVSGGLMIMGASMTWMTQFGTHAAYWGPVVISMMTLAVGFSLISSPSTSALMGSLSSAQIGAGAAVNETTREFGGTLGVAVVGSVFSSLFGHRIAEVLAPLDLSHHDLVAAQSSMQAALRVVSQARPSNETAASYHGISLAFMDGFHRGCTVAAATAIVVGVVSFFYLPRQAATPGHTQRVTTSHTHSA
jgi:DHA2 family multidrug resistance protein-like MFS transporter